MRWLAWATTTAVLALGCGGNTDENDGDGDGTALDGSGGTQGSSGGSDSGGAGGTASGGSSGDGGSGGSSGNGGSDGGSAGSGAGGGTDGGSGASGGGSGATGGSDDGSDDGRGGTDGNEPVEGTPAPDDFPEFTKGPYGYCSLASSGLPQMYCPENGASGGGTDNCLEWCTCQVSCDSDEDCPEPETGSTPPRCDGGECVLSCAGSTCPDGMRCIEMHSGEEQCAWAQEGEENLSCWLFEHPDYCEQFTTKEACQERMLTDPLQPPEGCIWMVETIHSTASPSCEPAAVTESCVPGMRQDCDLEGLSCPDSESWVFFRDIGAGTAALMTTDRCLMPGGIFGVSGEACSFGEPTTLPLLCDCACEL